MTSQAADFQSASLRTHLTILGSWIGSDFYSKRISTCANFSSVYSNMFLSHENMESVFKKCFGLLVYVVVD